MFAGYDHRTCRTASPRHVGNDWFALLVEKRRHHPPLMCRAPAATSNPKKSPQRFRVTGISGYWLPDLGQRSADS